MAKTVRSRKAKGRLGQAEIVDLLRSYFGFNEEDCYSRPASVVGDDIVLSKTARKEFNFSCEVKRQEKVSIWAWIEQAKENCGLSEPLVIFRRNNSMWYVCLDLIFFLNIWKELQKLRTKEFFDNKNDYIKRFIVVDGKEVEI